MPAFFKRRWILLMFAVALIACSTVAIAVEIWRPGPLTIRNCFGLSEGAFYWYYIFDPYRIDELSLHCSCEFLKRPEFGHALAPGKRRGSAEMILPLWMALAGVIGSIAFRELRWREKRARETSALQES